MSDMLTRCPQCSAAFRLTPEQFSAAKGMVRCGSCLHVFKADEHWVHPAVGGGNKQEQSGEAEKGSGFSFDQASIDSQSAEDFMSRSSTVDLKAREDQTSGIDEGIDDDDEDRRYSDEDEEKPSVEATPEDDDDFANLDDLLAESEDTGIDDEEEEDAPDEEWAKGLLDDLEDEPPPSLKQETAQEDEEYAHFEEELEEGSLDDDIDAEGVDAAEAPSGQNITDINTERNTATTRETVAPAKAGVDEDGGLDEGEPGSESLDDLGLDDDGLDDFDDLDSFSANLEADLDADELDSDNDNQALMEKLLVNEHSDAKRDLGLDQDDDEDEFDNKRLLSNIEPEPVDVSWNYASKDLIQPLIWLGLCLLMAGVFVGQYAYYNYEHLSKENAYRPWYEKACGVIGCKLPDQVDRSLIKTKNLVVRSHPAYKHVLVVDAILVNTANFVQPYPPIELFFNDTFKIPVASRRFMPEEYLGGEVSADSLMPVAKSIHITLEVMDPGEKAVGYLLEVSRHQDK
ncbi:MAG: zinc-ribbon domain-containing protein [Pseudomonadales bacterium]|nr:zinc-ribbon domain-containing protein [Pseudomonadales bacterium]